MKERMIMRKTYCMPLVIAAAASTILIVVLLALRIPEVFFCNAHLTLGLLGGLAIALIASENVALNIRSAQFQSGEEGYSTRRLHWHRKLALWSGVCLLAYVLLLANFITLGGLVLGLIPLWFLSFLVFSAVILLV